ncbi:hypothetical protein BgiBS90_034656, partial [Biomphalaria glabrata]
MYDAATRWSRHTFIISAPVVAGEPTANNESAPVSQSCSSWVWGEGRHFDVLTQWLLYA